MQPVTILLTRAQDQSEDFAGTLTRALDDNFRVAICPLVEIAFLDLELDEHIRAPLVFTSINAAKSVAEQLTSQPPCFVVGEETGRYLNELGFEEVHVFPTASALVEHIPENAVYFRGEDIRVDLKAQIPSLTEATVYRQVALKPERPNLDGEIILPVFSAFAAKALIETGWELSNAQIIAISPEVMSALGTKTHVAMEPSRDGMINAIGELLRNKLNPPSFDNR